MNGVQGVDSTAVNLLELMVSNDPYGAMSAKALLSLIKREPYKRVPWVFNDTVPGKSAMQDVLVTPFRIWPNPNTDGTLFIRWQQVSGSASFSLYDLIGREVLTGSVLFDEGYGSILLDGIKKGSYILRVEIGAEVRAKTVIIQ